MDVGVSQKETIFNGDVDRLDAVAGGYLSLALTDANTDLTETQQCNRVIAFTGALTAARTIFIIVTSATGKPRDWIVFNNTSGGFALTFKLKNVATGFGTGVSVTNGKRVGIYHTNPSAGGASGDVFKWTTEV
jgi:hypothetical protein